MTEPEVRRGGTILGRATSPTPAQVEEIAEVAATFEELAKEPAAGDAAVGEAAVRGTKEQTPPRPDDVVIPAPDGDGQVATPRSRWPLVGCVGLAVASLVLALLAVQQRSARQSERSQINELRDVSGRTVAALTSYDYQHLDGWKQSVLANATGSFQNQFTSVFPGFSQAYVAEHNRGTGAVQGVWVGPVDAGKATTVVLVQITVTSLTGTHALNPYMQLTLLKVAGRWRVDDVQATVDTGGITGATGTGSTAPTGPPSSTTPTSGP